MNLKTAARRLGVHYQTAYRWVRSGELVAVKVGAGYEISEAALARFQAQRDALERLPDAGAPAGLEPNPGTRADALAMLDAMAAAVTLDAAPVAIRAARLVADALGDGAVCSLRGDDGDLHVTAAAHRDPVREVTFAAVARAASFTLAFARRVARNGAAVFVPQVSQRDVRRTVSPELREHLANGGCFSLVCVPIGVDGALLVERDVPGKPYDRADLGFVEAVAARVAGAHARARAHRSAVCVRRRAAHAANLAARANARLSDLAGTALDALLGGAVADDPQAPIALVDLDGRHVACSKAYAAALGDDASGVPGRALAELVRGPDAVRAALASLLVGELDVRTVAVEPRAAGAGTTLHLAMVRRPDAAPWCFVAVAQEGERGTAVPPHAGGALE